MLGTMVGVVVAFFAFMAMNVAAQDDKMDGQMMMDKSKPTVARSQGKAPRGGSRRLCDAPATRSALQRLQ